MKSKKNQRLLALILSMVLMLSASISAMAEGDVQTEASGTETTENQAAVQSLEEETVPETEALTEETDTQSAEILEEPVQESAEQEITEEPAENTETPAETTEPVQEETGEPAETTETDQTIVQSPEVQEESAVTEEQPAETTEEVITEETAVSEAAELKQEFTDENGKVTQTITAYVPEGAFQATADQISMEVSFLNTSDTDYIKGMMEELLPENYYLDGYVLYQIDFKVDGEITQPAKAVTITMSGNDLAVEDTQKAHVFYYDPENPEVEGDKDQLAEVIQKDQLIKSLQESGQSTGNIEDYDYSEIAVNDGNADTITVKGWESTIYGCYVEKEAEPVELKGKAEDIQVTLSGPASSFPQEGELALSVKKVDKETKKIVKEAIEEEAENNGQEVVDYTALDITLLHNGEEIQPLGPVNVTFTKQDREKDAEEVKETKVFHVDEEKGTATDMEAAVNTSGEAEIETTHFSVYVVVDLDQLGGQIELTVQHWAYMDVLDGVDGSDGLSGPESDNSGPSKDTIATLHYKQEFTSIYSDDTVELFNIPKKIPVEDLSKVYAATEGENYNLKEVWVLRNYQENPGEIKDDSDAIWEKHSFPGSGDDTDTITLTKNSVIRFIYEPLKTENALIQDATFYDWNVTDGPNVDVPNGYYNAWAQNDDGSRGRWFDLYWTDQGINDVHASNNFNGGNDTNSLAVGMPSCGVFHYKENATIPGTEKLLNVYTQGTSGVKGIVRGVNENGPIYADGVYDADLFNNEPHTGKYIANDYDLVFDRNGDTYTFTAVNKDGNSVLTDLETFWETYDKWTYDSNGNLTDKKNLFSNNFWPLDTIENYSGKDPLWGDYTQAGGSGARGEQLRAIVPRSDDGNAHNWFFGMRYDFEFTIGDYTGPLNFYFRGDDDFWLFIDGELVVDLGGIHSSIGELCSLEHLRAEGQDLNQKHKATIIYAERGGTGSTCYMEFTMPNVEPLEFEPEPTTSVSVEKIWNDHNNPTRPDSIEVELYYKEPGTTEWKLSDTARLNSSNNWSYTWNKLPKEGYEYKVNEKGEKDGKFGKYTVTYNPANENHLQNTDGTWSGTITNTASPSTQINVTKIWDDGGNVSGARPDQVEFQLYYRTQGTVDWSAYPNGRLILNDSNKDSNNQNHWKGTYKNLPVYSGDTNTFLEYTVMEISNGQPIAEGGNLPGKQVGSETYIYTTNYTEPERYFNNGTWIGHQAVADGTTLELTVTNSQGREIEVIKQWKGTLENKIPDSIYVGLYLEGRPVRDKYIQLKKDEGWKGSFKYLGEGEYTVKELRETTGSESAEFTIDKKGYTGIESGKVTINDVAYDVTYSKGTPTNNKTTYTIINQGSWQMIKKSENGDLLLGGAEFTLTQGGSNPVYTGTSAENTGLITWKDTAGADVNITTIDDGTYTLTEKEAPTGYQPGGNWTITIANGVPTSITKTNSDGTTDNSEKGEYKDGILTFYYKNTALYALPSSGGSGIYWYLFGGILLMMAASLIVYKNKRGEVLERK